MRKLRIFALVAAALVAGLTAGSLGVAAASTKSISASSASTSAAPTVRPPGGPGGPAGQRDGGDMLVRVVAKLTGESTGTVGTARRSGTSFATIASAKGVSVEQVVGLASAADKAALDSEVSNGLITQTEADTRLADCKTQITDAVNATGQPQPPRGPGGGRGSFDSSATPPAGPPLAPPSAATRR